MDFKNYNDNELLYLINDGCEYALDLMFKKYSILIKKRIKENGLFTDKADDLLQEGLMVLYNCIKEYKPDKCVSFFSYFSFCLNRLIYKMLKTDYYKDYFLFNENIVDYNYIEDTSYEKILYLDNMVKAKFNDQFDIDLYNNCIIGNISIKKFSEDNNVSYYLCYKKVKEINTYLKKLLTKATN